MRTAIWLMLLAPPDPDSGNLTDVNVPKVGQRFMAGKLYRLLLGPLSRAFAIVVFAIFLFLALGVVAPADPVVVSTRVRTAFETGELGLADYLPFDTHRGTHQYDDCLILQLLSNPNPCRLKRALAPIVYSLCSDGEIDGYFVPRFEDEQWETMTSAG